MYRRCRSIRCRRRAICGCSAGIVSSAATARSRRTSSACSVASRRTLWSPTRLMGSHTMPGGAPPQGELKLSGFDLSLTGFGDLELKDIMAERTEGLTDPDDVPPVPEHPVSQTGAMWLLGRNRLPCD